ncbi:MAG: pyridoxamine 5'-phosphate oxidase family protein [Chloroflexota bacterium]
MIESVTDLALAYLEQHQVMTLATTGPEGVWATAVFYVNEEFTLYFLSAGHTRHAQNFLHQSHVAAAVQEDYRDWVDIKGIQLEGVVELLHGIQKTKAIARYHKKYPFLAQADARMAAALTRVNWYRLTPARLYFIDNSKGLGHRDQVVLPT